MQCCEQKIYIRGNLSFHLSVIVLQAKRNEEVDDAQRRLVAACEDFVGMVSEETQLGPGSHFSDAEGLLSWTHAGR